MEIHNSSEVSLLSLDIVLGVLEKQNETTISLADGMKSDIYSLFESINSDTFSEEELKKILFSWMTDLTKIIESQVSNDLGGQALSVVKSYIDQTNQGISPKFVKLNIPGPVSSVLFKEDTLSQSDIDNLIG